MDYREIEETITLRESGAGSDLPVNVDGEITVSETDIATDPDVAADEVHVIASKLSVAIDEVLEEHREAEE